MRSIVHPGTPAAPRAPALPCHVHELAVTFAAGRPVLEAVTEALAPLGIDSAVVEIAGGVLDPLVYVMPAPSDDGVHAAWYSETHAPEGRSPIEAMTFSYGRRDGEPFLHCHGIWRHADGSRHAGHLMPMDARFAEPVEARVLAVSGAVFDQLEDDETRFRLFTPVAHDGPPEGQRGLLCRIKPNVDVHRAIEQVCADNGITSASLHGIGSLVGCDFVTGARMTSYASELFIRSGSVERRDGTPVATLDIAIVDIDGGIFEGEIERGGNVVCVTFELLLVER